MKKAEQTVFIVDDDQEVRKSLKWLIESAGLKVRTFTCAQTFLDAYKPGLRGCVLLDVRMPGISGLELLEKLREMRAAIPVLIITGHADVPMAVRALKAGATEFIEKPLNDQLLLDRIRSALESEPRSDDEARLRAEVAARLAQLTTRERQVMELVVAGRVNREIAAELGLNQKTIEAHRSSLMEKLKADSLADVVRFQMLVNPETGTKYKP
jgi:two-component system, LuxR family, response regulator FixJ